MKKIVLTLILGLVPALAPAQEFNRIPLFWKWISDTEVAFTYNGSFKDDDAFSVDAPNLRVIPGTKVPARFTEYPYMPKGGHNLTWSPDSTMLAFTRGNDLYVYDLAERREKRLTFDGSDVILNGYASWVYYEEIFGRASLYRAFWWSPDSRRIGFYRFDNSAIPMFPI